MIRKAVTYFCCLAALATPVSNAFALARAAGRATSKIAKKTVPQETTTVTKEVVDGPIVKCHHWGYMEVQLAVIKTVKTDGSKKTVSIRITKVSWPVFPNHTPRSIQINIQALPLLQQETMQFQAQAANDLINISGASNTTVSWLTSLQAALTKAETP